MKYNFLSYQYMTMSYFKELDRQIMECDVKVTNYHQDRTDLNKRLIDVGKKLCLEESQRTSLVYARSALYDLARET